MSANTLSSKSTEQNFGNIFMGKWRILAPILVLFSFSEIVSAQVLATATRTIFLSHPGQILNHSSIAYHPDFDQYYGAQAGSPGYQGFVYNSSGTLIHTQDPLNIDVRAINFNPNTGLMEVVTFAAVDGGAGFGLIDAQLDGSGFYTGGTEELLASMPGNDGSQTMPAYDPSRDRFYSRGGSNNVNIVARTDGSLLGTITLDFTTAGVSAATANALGFAPSQDWLIVTDAADNTAAVFDLDGNHLGTSALDVDVPGSFNVGFANGQLFVRAGEGYQGFDIGADASPPPPPPPPPEPPPATPPTAIPTIGTYGLILTALGLLILAARRLAGSRVKNE